LPGEDVAPEAVGVDGPGIRELMPTIAMGQSLVLVMSFTREVEGEKSKAAAGMGTP
jgi:hypothetical protein